MAFSPYTGGSSGTYTVPTPKPPIPPGGYQIPSISSYMGTPTQGLVPGLNPSAVASAGTQNQTLPSIDFSKLDFSNDPILGRIKALSQESIGQAEAEAQAARTRLVIGYGSDKLAKSLGLNQKIGNQAAKNPYSTLRELKRAYNQRNVNINSNLSDYHNLFYSTERGKQLFYSAQEKLRGKSQAESAVQERLAQISGALAQTRLQAQLQQVQAEQDAYQRAVQRALYSSGMSSSI